MQNAEMQPDVLASLPIRRGHFRLESGLHTDVWIEFEPLFREPRMLAAPIAALARLIEPFAPTAICGPFVGGAFLALGLASHLGVRFYFAEKITASGDHLFSAQYRIPEALVPGLAGERIVVVDEAISAGSSVRATIAALEGSGAEVAAIATLALLGTVGEDHFRSAGTPVVALAREALALWKPDDCPLCREAVPLSPDP